MAGRKRNMLLVVEGQKEEPKLVEALFRVFNPKTKWIIHPYKTVIYELIEKIVNEYEGDYENVEIVRILADMLSENDPARDMLIYTKFTDIVLMFDFDPQDNRFNAAELRRMMLAFNDSTDTDKGLLLINYPAVEAIKDAALTPYEEFFNSFLSASDVEGYKAAVNKKAEGGDPRHLTSFDNFNGMVFVKLIAATVGKIQHLVFGFPFDETFPIAGRGSLSDSCWEACGVDLLDFEVNEFYERKRVAPCGTGAFVIAFWQKALDGTWKACFGE